ncbi:MFS general substrate transporter [Cystobasidium minutum MCA 4210]|uniref:MFS general substrate transporter n=1 Tax=Cystobasidium minutum MCA 4210 TaxID=1397322 RepID=UPI0034CEBFC7|eukprot:jgi/Rhomi1/155699/estExt_Genewise1.C_80293
MAVQADRQDSFNGKEEIDEVQHVPETFDNTKFGLDEKGEDLDIGAQALTDADLQYTKEEHNKVLRKIDWRLMPICAWACGLQFVDKGALGAAATYGMREDIHLVGQEFSWCVTVFYFGYLIGAPIMARIVQRYHAGRVLGMAYFLWACTLLGMIGVKNFGSIMALRFLLGFFESALVPGLLLVTTMWYNPTEMPLRFGLWTVTNGVLPVPMLIIYYGLGYAGTDSLASWKLIFLFLGLISAATGVVLFFFLPDNPTSVSWLNAREKAIAVHRNASTQIGIKNSHFKWDQAREAFKDYRVWMVGFQMFFALAFGNVTVNFVGIIIKGLGYTALKAQLYTAPNSAVQAFTQICISGPPTFFHWFRDKKQPLAATWSAIGIAGVAILLAVPARPDTQSTRLAGVILTSTTAGNYTVIMSVIGCNFTGFTKKQVVTSITFTLYCITNIITPQTFLQSEAPGYRSGLIFTLSMLVAYIILSYATWFDMRRENKRRDQLALTDPSYSKAHDNSDVLNGLRDLTDRTNPHFRYSG